MKQISLWVLVAFLHGVLFSSPSFALDRKLLGEECYQALHDTEKASAALIAACRRKIQDLPTLVVTPTRSEKELRDVPASTAVVTAEQIERKAVDVPAEALRDVPGVSISDSGQPGLRHIRIRGEESRRVAILVDGQEFIEHREVGTPLLISPELVDRIEVVRGPGSVLYGSQAIGGVVNFITKKGGYHPAQATASATFDSATEGQQYFGSFYGSKDGFDYRVAGAGSNHHNRHTPVGDIENTSFENQDVYVYGAKRWDNLSLGLSFEDFEAESEVYVEPEVRTTPPFLDFRLNVPQRDRNKVALFGDWTSEDGVPKKVHIDSYYQQSDRQFDSFSKTLIPLGPIESLRESAIYTGSSLDTTGLNVQVDVQPLPNHDLVTGLKFKNDDFEHERFNDVLADGMVLPRTRVGDNAFQRPIELYAQDDWKFVEHWGLTAGVRGYSVKTELQSSDRVGLLPQSTTDEGAIAAASLRYDGIRNSTLWLGWSQGYVTPSLTNMATGAFAGPSYVNPNPDLDSESSNSFDLGYRYDDGLLNLDSAVFYTRATDYIDHVLCSSSTATCLPPAGPRDRVYVNIDEAQTFGAELFASVRLNHVSPYINATWLRRKFERGTFQTYDTGLPIFAGRFGVEAQHYLAPDMLGWVDLYQRLATDAEEVSDAGASDHKSGWGTLNLSLGAKLGKTGQYRVAIDVQNIFDKEYLEASENVLAAGRSVTLKLVVDL